MEEILASIRRIISEDETPAEAAPAEAAASPAPEPTPEPEPEPVTAEAPPPAPEPDPPPAAEAFQPAPEPAAPEPEDDDLELTHKVETHGDRDVLAPVAPEPALAPAPPPVEALVSDRVATAAASAFGQLSAAIAMPHSDRTLEDVVRELLRPLLQQWLDDNLPTIVREAVEGEVERISRARR